MKIIEIKRHEARIVFNLLFSDENEEQDFLENLITLFNKDFPVHCILTDLETSFSLYKKYFLSSNYYIIDHLTSVSLFAYNLSPADAHNVISNWGYYTIDAIFAFGVVEDKLQHQKSNIINVLKDMPIVITQVLDNSIEIVTDICYYGKVLDLVGQVNF